MFLDDVHLYDVRSSLRMIPSCSSAELWHRTAPPTAPTASESAATSTKGNAFRSIELGESIGHSETSPYKTSCLPS